jgi:hypothetical protein
MTTIYTKFSGTGAPVLNVDDAGGVGLPVIFQHGLCGDAGQTIEAFPRDLRFRRITIESRGHGRSEAGAPGLFSIRTFAADIVAFIEAHRLGPMVIGGISLIVGHEIDYIHPFSYATALSQLILRSQLVRITPKAVSKAAYLKDLHKAITNFLETFPDTRMLQKVDESPS